MIGSGRTKHRETVLVFYADAFHDMQRDRLEGLARFDSGVRRHRR